jgi:hypothetical protein
MQLPLLAIARKMQAKVIPLGAYDPMGIAFWSAFSSTLLWTYELMLKLGTR